MNKIYLFLLSIIFITPISALYAQNILTLDQVFQQIDNNNYQLKLLNQNVRSAHVLTSKYNRGYKPTLSATAGVNTAINSQKQVFNFNFPDFELTNGLTYSANAGITAGYLLYDGGNRKLQNSKNETNLEYSQLLLDQSKQNLHYNAAVIYYSIAQSLKSAALLQKTYLNSKERLQQIQVYYDYGSRTRVDLLNAKVDLMSDSLEIINLETSIKNLKLQLNELMLGQNTDYMVDTTVDLRFQGMSETVLLDQLLQENFELKSMRQNLELNDYDRKLADKINAPRLNASGTYNLSYQEFSDKYQSDYSQSNGFNAGINANWNILDGGQQEVQRQLSQLQYENAQLEIEQKANELRTRFSLVWNTYKNNLSIVELQKENILTARANFDRIQELFLLGQQSSIEFRQAQLNQLNAELLYQNALYSAKLNEVELEFLLGE